nr:Rha family transcriptional regulator [Edwardsiella ictaluri]
MTGLTGKRGAAFKETDIAGFNRMERPLFARQQGDSVLNFYDL